MGENSKIQWTDHTFNPWWGCMKVSDGCRNCYAETLDHRFKGSHWGPDSERKAMSERYWAHPLKWNEEATKAGIPAKVFCASMADVFEDNPQVVQWRAELFDMIRRTPHLIWQLLTKRPENVLRMMPEDWRSKLPYNVWMGTSVENDATLQKRIEDLLPIPASVLFLSCEPLLGPLHFPLETTQLLGIDWVIAGGESGQHARPVHPDWVRYLRDQCQEANVPFFFKQWGEYMPFEETAQPPFYRCSATGEEYDGHGMNFVDPQTSEPGKWGKHAWMDGFEAMMICEEQETDCMFLKMGTENTGRLLDGREWNEFPQFLLS